MSNPFVCVYESNCRVERIAWQSIALIETNSGDFESSTNKSVGHIAKYFFCSTFGINNTPNIYQNYMRATARNKGHKIVKHRSIAKKHSRDLPNCAELVQ